MQRDREVHLQLVAPELFDAGDEPDRRHRDAARRIPDTEPCVGEDPDRRRESLVVRKRLSHAHEDEVRDAVLFSGQVVRREELADDLPGRQVAIEPHRPGQAERALETAADLGRKAEGHPVVVRHQHRADASAVVETEHELPAAVPGLVHALDLRQPEGHPVRQRGAELPRQIGHPVEIAHSFPIDPRRELSAAIPGRAELDREIFHLRGKQPDQIRAGHRTKNITRSRGRTATRGKC